MSYAGDILSMKPEKPNIDPAMALGLSYSGIVCTYLEATGSCTCYIAQLYISEYIFTIRLSWIMSLRTVGRTGQSQIPVDLMVTN